MSDLIARPYTQLTQLVEARPWLRTIRNVVFYVVVLRLGLSFFWRLYDCGPRRLLRDLKKYLLLTFFTQVKRLPLIKGTIQGEISKNMDQVRKSLIPQLPEGLPVYNELPKEGLTPEEIEEQLSIMKDMGKHHWQEGKISGAVYHGGEDITKISVRAYEMFTWSNPLHPDVFPGVRKMEAEVIAMVVKMFNGNEEACGTTTSGGTESILMACRAYREWGKAVKGITKPEIVVPSSVHCAFDKACDYFGIKLVHVPVSKKTWSADIEAMRRAITSNTVALVGSAPSFPHGTMDDIQGLAALARRYNVGLHVDSCLGGFLVPFMAKAGYPLRPFDFRVPGVTSISCDTHKYGFAPKGSSVILYCNKELRSFQYFVAPDWPGGIYASPTIAGSRPGALIAACWATMMSVGEEGYVRATREVIANTRKIATGIKSIPGLKLLGEPLVSVVAFTSDHFDIYRLGEEMNHRGWNLNNLQYPSSIHLCLTPANMHRADDFVADLQSIAAELMKNPAASKAQGAGAIYGMSQAVPDRSIIDQIARGYIDVLFESTASSSAGSSSAEDSNTSRKESNN